MHAPKDNKTVQRSGSPSHMHQRGNWRAGLLLKLIQFGPFIILAILALIFSIASPFFLRWGNLQAIMMQASPTALVALGQLFVVLTRGIDISIGSTVGLATVIGALAATSMSSNPALVIIAMLATGAAVGLVNATVIVRLKINNPFIVTLAMLSLVLGVSIILSGNGGQSLGGIPAVIQNLATTTIIGVPMPFIMTLAVAAAASILLNHARWGRWIYAIGGNPSAANRVGIPAGVVITSCYVFAGVAAGMAGLLVAGRFGSGFVQAGASMELDSIAAVVIGGASIYGGRGGVSAAIVGSLIIAAMRNGLNVAGVTPDWQLIAVGGILIGALWLDELRARVEERTRAAEGRTAELGPQAAFAADNPANQSCEPRSDAVLGESILEVRGVTKRFGAVLALNNVDLSLRRGEILALLGDNGAGKSTLVRAITGVHRVDEGEIILEGKRIENIGAAAVRTEGIETVHQDLALFDNLSAVENLFAGRELFAPAWLPRLGCVQKRLMTARTRSVLSNLQVGLSDPRQIIGLMSGGQRQAIAVARAQMFASRIVILDEPTAALGLRESRAVLNIVKALPRRGVSVILISHNLDHVAEVADRAVVLRRGQIIGEAVPNKANHEKLVGMIVGSVR